MRHGFPKECCFNVGGSFCLFKGVFMKTFSIKKIPWHALVEARQHAKEHRRWLKFLWARLWVKYFLKRKFERRFFYANERDAFRHEVESARISGKVAGGKMFYEKAPYFFK